MRAVRPLVLVLALLGPGAIAGAAPAAPVSPQAARRKLVEPTHDYKTLRTRLGLRDERWGAYGTSGRVLDRDRARGEDQRRADYGHYQEALSRLTDLDPGHNVLSPSEWEHLKTSYQQDTVQVRNAHEGIEFGLQDHAFRLKQTRALLEKARGKLASVLTAALRGKRADPQVLAEVCEGLSKKYPFFGNAFHVEYFISDVKGLSPGLARWDFSRQSGGQKPARLPPKMQSLVKELGSRVFSHANVLFADHLYNDGHVMVDTMKALGLDPKNARYVTTPYPFDAKVIAGMEARGVAVGHAPYDKDQTKALVEKSLRELIALARENHNPILIIDDGGMAAQVIAEKFPEELWRFRMVEITKAGERVAKQVLPPVLHDKKTLWYGLKTLNSQQLLAVKERFLVANSSDAATRAVAEKKWADIMSWVRTPSMSGDIPHQLTMPAHMFGFAHYTYSDSDYKRNVMTPLYTQAVNRATFEALDHQGLTPPNKRVAIIGGGAMGLNAALELRDKGYEVTFVEPDEGRRKVLAEHQFKVEDLKPALKDRGLIMELSGMHDLITAEHLFGLMDNAVVLHGSSKDNPFDMTTIKALADETIAWKPGPTGQQSASYVFHAAGQKRTLHFPGNGFTISHGGKDQNVPLKKFLPEVSALVRLAAHAVTNDQVVTHYPFFGTPDWLTKPGEQQKRMRSTAVQTLDLTGEVVKRRW